MNPLLCFFGDAPALFRLFIHRRGVRDFHFCRDMAVRVEFELRPNSHGQLLPIGTKYESRNGVADVTKSENFLARRQVPELHARATTDFPRASSCGHTFSFRA